MIFIIITFISVSLSGPIASVFKFFYFFIYYFWLRKALVAALGLLSSCGEQGPLSSWGVPASRGSGSSCFGAQALGTQASVAVVHGLLAPGHSLGIFQDQGSNSYPLHWQVDSSPLDQQGSRFSQALAWSLLQNHSLGLPFSSERAAWSRSDCLCVLPSSSKSSLQAWFSALAPWPSVNTFLCPQGLHTYCFPHAHTLEYTLHVRTVASVVSKSSEHHGLQPTRLLCPWDFPGKNTGMGFHALLQGNFPAKGLNPTLCFHLYSLMSSSPFRSQLKLLFLADSSLLSLNKISYLNALIVLHFSLQSSYYMCCFKFICMIFFLINASLHPLKTLSGQRLHLFLLLSSPWTASRSNQSILKEINPEHSLEGLMLKLQLQYFSYLMQRADSLEKSSIPFFCQVLKGRLGFPGGLVVKNSPVSAGNTGFIPRLGRSPGEGNGNPFQYPGLENPMDRGGWWATAHTVAKSQT